MKQASLALLLLICASTATAQVVYLTEFTCSAQEAPAASQAPSTGAELTAPLYVPVHFHIIRDVTGGDDVSDATLDAEIDLLNTRFGNIKFFLSGVTRLNNGAWHDHMASGQSALDNDQANAAKQALHIDPARVLNVYVTETAGGDNYASMPDMVPDAGDYRRGVVLLRNTLPGMGAKIEANGATGDKDHGETLAHEIGHFFNLYHTFHNPSYKNTANGTFGSCADPEGDHLEGTPKHEQPLPSQSIAGTNTMCSGYNTPAEQELARTNLMNYMSDNHRQVFTNGQRSRMYQHVVSEMRSNTARHIYLPSTFAFYAGASYHFTDSTTIHVPQNVALTIPVGTSVTLDAGVQLAFASGASLAVNGTLDVNVGSGGVVTFAGPFTANSGSVVTIGGVGQTITFAQGATINAGAQFAVRAGTTVQLGTSANLNLWAPVSLDGTPTNPIRIQRSDSSAWNQITLLANGNMLDNVVLDGGTQNIVVASRNNTLRGVRSKGGWRNLSTWYDQATGGRSQVSIVNSVFESATSVGIVMQHVDAFMDSTTIRTSEQAGLYVINADVGAATSLIEGNSTSSSRSGIEVGSGGYVSLGDEGNLVRNNALHEVQVINGAGAWLGLYNSIYDTAATCSSSERLVYNSSGSTVYADENWWGSAAPSSTCFHTNVSAGDPLYYDPLENHNPGAGGSVPNYATAEPVMVAGGGGPYALASTETAPAGEVGPNDTAEALRRVMQELRDLLSTGNDAEDATAQLHDLHGLMLRDGKDALGERQANLDVLRRWSRLLSGNPVGSTRAAAELAATLEVWEALRTDRYDEAERLARQYAPLVEGADVSAAIQMQRVALLERSGRFGEALGVIAEVRQTREVRAREQGMSDAALLAETAALTTREETLQRLMEAPLWPGAQQTGEASQAETLAAEAARAAEVPQEMTVRAQPNPFSGRAVIRYALPEHTHVRLEVYDVMGRRVALLVDAARAEGTHEAAFDGTGLSSGTYFYRITTLGQTHSGTMLLVE